MMRTASPYPDGAKASKHRPRDSKTRTAANPLPSGIIREAEASPLHETRDETQPRGAASMQRHRNGQITDDDTPTRRHDETRTRHRTGRERTPRHAAREERPR